MVVFFIYVFSIAIRISRARLESLIRKERSVPTGMASKTLAVFEIHFVLTQTVVSKQLKVDLMVEADGAVFPLANVITISSGNKPTCHGTASQRLHTSMSETT